MSSDSVQLCLSRKTGEMLQRLRANRPLVHCITNEVVQEITADVLLAAGASPAMVVGEGEAEYFAGIASALSVNVGTPYEARIETMKKAIRGALAAGKPWVRGNASEIRFLAGVGTGGKGVDSLDDSSSAIEAAKALARKYKTFVVVTGHKDYATDGERVLCAVGGSEMMTLVVGTGCSLSALLAAFLGGAERSLEACIACCDYVNYANDTASTRSSGPGSFHVQYLDALYQIRPEDFRK